MAVNAASKAALESFAPALSAPKSRTFVTIAAIAVRTAFSVGMAVSTPGLPTLVTGVFITQEREPPGIGARCMLGPHWPQHSPQSKSKRKIVFFMSNQPEGRRQLREIGRASCRERV